MYFVSRGDNIQLSGRDIVFFDNKKKYLANTSLYRFGESNPFQSSIYTAVDDMIKQDEDEEAFFAALEEAMNAYNITPSQISSISLPMTTECLSFNECPTEEEFCTDGKDPNCSASPYQEPEASLNAGGIALIVIICVVAVAAAGYVLYKRASEAQKKRYKGDCNPGWEGLPSEMDTF